MRAVVPVGFVLGITLFVRFALPDGTKQIMHGYQNPNFGPAPSPYPVTNPRTVPARTAPAEEPAADVEPPVEPRTGNVIPRAAPTRKARPAAVHPAERLLNQPPGDGAGRVVP